MSAADMIAGLQALRAYYEDGAPVPHSVGATLGPVTWETNLRSILNGGSANHGLIRHVCGMLRGEELSILYLEDRCAWELANGIGINEQQSPSYYWLHVGLWAIMADRGPRDLADLATTWLERSLAITSLCSALDEDGYLRIYTPGPRRDKPGKHEPEEVIMSLLLGLPDHGKHPWGDRAEGLVGALRAMEDPEALVPASSRLICRVVIANKTKLHPGLLRTLDSVRLMAPITWRSYGSDTWAAWIYEGLHPQDPAQMATVYRQGAVAVLHPDPEGNPAEGGWSSYAGPGVFTSALIATWMRAGKEWHVKEWHAAIDLPPGPYRQLIIGAGEVGDAPLPRPDPPPPEPPPSGLTPAQARADEHLRMARAHLAEIAAGRPTYQDDGTRSHAESARVLVGLAAKELTE
jgi:hypothetical protein